MELSPDELPVFSTEVDPEAECLRKEQYLRARTALLALEEPYRNVFILHALSGQKLKDIAGLYGKSESWARVTYFRARTKIMEEMEK